MEGRGFLEAAHINSVVATVIRGISDKLSGKARADGAGWQKRAADAASAVAFEMLAKLGSSGPTSVPPTKPRPKDGTRVRKGPKVSGTTMVTQTAPPPTRFLEVQPTLNDGSFFDQGEVLARVGVPNVDEVIFSFTELPDGFIRIIPKTAKSNPIPNAALLEAGSAAPLLKHRQYGCFACLNARGVLAYDPRGPYRGGPAPLAWATQLFPSGELWLASNTVVVRERGGRPAWIPIPFIPAFLTEQTFYDKVHAAVEFSVSRLGLTSPYDIQMGALNLKGVHLALSEGDIRGPIQTEKVVRRQTISSGAKAEIDSSVLAFFELLHDATGYARPKSLYHFPPEAPRL
jgi:hypothetical protein